MTRSEEFYDDLEIRDPQQREEEQFQQLRDQLANAKQKSSYYGDLLKDLNPEDIRDRSDLAQLPTLRKSDLVELQKKTPPLGGLATVELRELKHIFASPGGIFEPGGYEKDFYGYARGLWAAGVRPGDLIHNTFSYHLVPAGLFVDSGAQAIGCPVFPGGTGNTEVQLQAMAALKPAVYAGTPSFLRILLEKAQEMGLDISSVKKGLVGAEALPPSLRKHLSSFGVEVLQGYGTADLGNIAYESKAVDGMIIEENRFVELVEPLGTKPVGEGEVGEIVVTTFNKTYPLLRFATGDLSELLPGISPCGRTNMRIKGWLGRADQTTKVRGMFVHPSLVQQVTARHPEITKARMIITSEDNKDQMTLKIAATNVGDGFTEAVVSSIRAVIKLRGEVEVVEAASLPDDGNVIDDQRSYE